MGAVEQGQVVRFDPVKGYGFIAPRSGGEDIFLHVNDLLDDKHLMKPGVIVEFLVENGDRGLKASSVHMVLPAAGQSAVGAMLTQATATTPVAPAAAGAPVADVAPTGRPAATAGDSLAGGDDDLVDVLPESEVKREVTEILLRVDPSLTGLQILAIREAVVGLGNKYGWIG